MINKNKLPSKRIQKMRELTEKYADEEPVEITENQKRHKEEDEAILVKPQPKSNGRIGGIEI